MAQDERAQTSGSRDPDPAGAGPGDGERVVPGGTPPDAGQMSGAAGDSRRDTPNMGPVSGNRTPMIIALSVLALIVIAFAVIVGASFIPS